MSVVTIKVGFSTHSNDPVSWLIRKLTHSEASHAWVLIEEPFFGVPMVFEAVGSGGFRLVTFEHFKASGNKIVAMAKVPVDARRGIHAAVEWLGKPYDHKAFFGYSLVLLGRWFKRQWRNPFRSSKALYCSEAVVRILQASSLPGSKKFVPDETTPQDLMDFFKERGWLKFY